MYIKFLTIIIFFLTFTGCDINDLANNNPVVNNNKTVPTLSELNSDIKNGKVKGYNSAKTKEEKYLAVINYMRSLPIICQDSRANQGPVKALNWSKELTQAAKEHDDDMLQTGNFSHTGSDGSTPKDRIIDNGFNASYYGENISYHQHSAPYTQEEWKYAIIRWLNSETGHCSNLMSPNFDYVGMDEVKKTEDNLVTLYWTQDFGKK